MGFITAFLLNFFDEENSFWMLASIIKNFKLTGYFLHNLN